MIIRRRVNEPFIVVPKRPMENTKLSWGARGVLAFLLGKPDGWKANSEHLATCGPGGRDQMRKYFRELTDAGHLNRRLVQDERGRLSWEIDVIDVPGLVTDDGFSGDGPGKPMTGEPTVGKPSRNKEPRSKNRESIPSGADAPSGRFAPNPRMLKLVATWNAMAALYGLAPCEGVTKGLQGMAMQRHREVVTDEAFIAVMERIARSPHCLGKNDKGWKASFNWFVVEENFTKLRNGAYEGMGNRPKEGRAPAGFKEMGF